MIGTLEDGLKEEFKPKVKKTWIKVFEVVEAQMKIGMRQAESEVNFMLRFLKILFKKDLKA